ncbi:hypothetical protein GMST_42060 [Geomonas silvestris]|uniref:Uncharacterized protein n=1 Tax=Geomonas silvestris TaxID=2740184 RepID=A0A6V8MPG3_9BACT|nr:hypothetical protein GMST_42060 [Geomonas silvestris]
MLNELEVTQGRARRVSPDGKGTVSARLLDVKAQAYAVGPHWVQVCGTQTAGGEGFDWRGDPKGSVASL